VPALVRRALLAMTASLLLVPAAAHASWQSVITDCTKDGRINQHHSLKDYTQALQHLGSDVIEYTDCQGVIRRAQLAAAGGGAKKTKTSGATNSSSGGGTPNGGSSSSGGPTASAATHASQPVNPPANNDPLATASAGQRSAVTHAIRSGGEPVKVGNQLVDPAALGASPVGSPTSLPPALIVMLVALGIGALGIGIAAVLPRVRARRAR
jgi:hypothetical protein